MFNTSLELDDLAGVTTSFHVAREVAGRLKSLLEFVCESLVQRATAVLEHCSPKGKRKAGEKNSKVRVKAVYSVIKCLFLMYPFAGFGL